jgi:hypothetical protein
MKRILIISSLILSIPVLTFACDICGCGVGTSYIGILPDFNKTIMGVRYRYNSLRTQIGAGGAITYLTTNERYRTIEPWGGWNIAKRTRLLVSMPIHFNERENQEQVKKKTGIGDVSVVGYYEILNKRKTVFIEKLLIQSLWIGGGIKLPTGKYAAADKSGAADNSNLFQLGTGSIDFTANVMYDVRLQDAGININAGYKINTTNRYNYRYGNKFNGSAQAYYKFRIKDRVTIAPNAGVLYETAGKDRDAIFKTDISGGNILLGTLGFETAFKKIMVGGNFQAPLSQRLANGFVNANERYMLHVAYLL